MVHSAPVKTRCAWARGELDIRYHDDEWGVPLHDDDQLFELLTLEGAQAGLSWSIVLKKRDAYRKAFDGFDPRVVARYTEAKKRRLLQDEGIVRNRAKIDATVENARAFLDVQREWGTFDKYLWSFVGGRPIVNAWTARLPAETEDSRNLSKHLRKRGFRFVGPTICYAFMQASGLVNDHAVDCFRWRELGGRRRRAVKA